MSFIHGFQGGKEFFSHLDLVFKGSMRVIGIVKGSERGFIDNFLSEGEVGGFIGIKFIQLLYCGERWGSFSRSSIVFGYFGFGLWRFFMTSAGVAISESTTPGNMVVDIG